MPSESHTRARDTSTRMDMSVSANSLVAHTATKTEPRGATDQRNTTIIARDATVPVGRRLIVCIDGTSNQYSDKNTNVIELYSHIDKLGDQLTYYNSGIGTYARPSWRSFAYWTQVLYNAIDLAIAWNVEKVIIAAYRWLSDNYRDGDKIFLFGFSRGAYQVRAIAGMIEKIGLIFSGNQEQIPFAFELYANCGTHPGDDEKAATFKETFSRKDVSVHFIGVWDTVSSVGFRRSRLLPLTDVHGHVTHFRHALALDERRVKFSPECVLTNDPGSDAKEVWFAGTHSDIGGGNTTNPWLDRSAEALIWMMDEAKVAGLRFSRLHESRYGIEMTSITESLRWGWWIFEVLPIRRPCPKNPNQVTYWPNLGRGRLIQPHQKIHASVPYYHGYMPKALWSDKNQLDWVTLLGSREGPVSKDWKLVCEGDSSIFYVLDQVRRMSNQVEWIKGFAEKAQEETHANKIWEYGRLEFLIKLADIGKGETKDSVKVIIRAVVGIGNRVEGAFIDESTPNYPTQIYIRDYALPSEAIKETVIPRLANLLACTDEKVPRRRHVSPTGSGVASGASNGALIAGQNGSTQVPNKNALVCFALEILREIALEKVITEQDVGRVMPILALKLRSGAQFNTNSQVTNEKSNSGSTWDVEAETLRTLESLCSKACGFVEHVREWMSPGSTAKLLISYLQHSDSDRAKWAMKVIANLTEDERFQVLFAKNVTSILDCIDQFQPGLTVQAARATANMAATRVARIELMKHQVVARCYRLLSPESSDLAQQSLRIVANLAKDSDAREEFLINNILQQCAELLNVVPDNLAKETLHTIGALSTQGYIAAELFEEHVFRHLVPLLGNAGLRADALGVVLELISDEYFRGVLLDRGVIETIYPLLEMAERGEDTIEALRVLKKFASYKDGQDRLMGDKNISTVIALLGNQHHHVPVVDMIAELASHAETKSTIIKRKVHVQLIDIIREDRCHAAPQAMRALAFLTDNEEVQSMLLERFAYEDISNMLQEGLAFIRYGIQLSRDFLSLLVQNAFTILVNMAGRDDICHEIISRTPTINTLVEMACSADAEVASGAIKAIKALAKNADVRKELLVHNIVTKLVPRFSTDEPGAAFELIVALSAYEDINVEISKRGVIAALDKHKERATGELVTQIQNIINQVKSSSQYGVHALPKQQDDIN